MGKLQKKLEDYNNQDYCPMHMPGHKRNTQLLGKKLPYNIDITEIDGFDDLHHSEGILKNIQDKAQKLYNSKKSFMLVNGSTCGILAGIRSVVKQKDTILVARNCHKSVYHAIEINELNPIYINPEIDEYGIAKGIEAKDIEKNLKENKEISLIVLTSPTYEGVISNLKEISKVAHKYNVPLLIDEAHGAHLKFMKNGENKEEALNACADIVIQSLHKTLPALTQCALLHVQGDLVDYKNVSRELSIFETSSPSYILMSSIEECLDIVQNEGISLFSEYEKNIKDFYDKSKNLKKLKILGNVKNNSEFYDYGKIVILTNKTNISGKELATILREKYKIETEMAYTNYVIAMTSICDSKNNFKRLIDALIEIDSNLKPNAVNEKQVYIENPIRKMNILEAVQSDNIKKVNYKNAIGKVSKEYIWFYPPGIPLITPGEVIDKNIINKINEFIKAKIEIRTDSEEFPNIKVI